MKKNEYKTETIIDKLEHLQHRLQELKSVNYQDGTEEYNSITQLLERIIDRIYPEKDAKLIKRKLYREALGAVGGETESDMERQEDYVDNIGLSIRVIDTIKSEYALFGFDDFKPMKEMVETEWQIGSDKIGYVRKKKSN